MASGPSVTLWLFSPIGNADIPGLLDGCSTDIIDVEELREGSAGFRISATDDSGSGLKGRSDFFVKLGDVDLDPADDYSQVGREAVQELVVWSGEDSKEGEIFVGRLALCLARQVDSLIDFDGLLGPSEWSSSGEAGEYLMRAREVRDFVHSIPGKIVEVGYAMYGGEMRYAHVGDADFLESWLNSPFYHLLCEWQ